MALQGHVSEARSGGSPIPNNEFDQASRFFAVSSGMGLGEKVVGDEAILQLEYHYADGSTPAGPMRYVRIGDEWRQALDFGEPEQGKMSTSLQAEGANSPTRPVTGK